MPSTKSLFLTLSSLAICTATPSLAQVTAAELWAEWQEMNASVFGQTVTAGSTIESDSGLTLQNVTSRFADTDVESTLTIDEIVMTNNADGTVTITLSETLSQNVNFEERIGAPRANVDFDIQLAGATILASGEGNGRSYEYSFDGMTIDGVELSGGGSEPPSMALNLQMGALAASYGIADVTAENMAFTSSSSLESLYFAVDVQPPAGEDGNAKLGFSMAGLTASASGTLGNYYEALAAPGTPIVGLDMALEGTYERISSEFDFVEFGDEVSARYSNAGGSVGATVTPTSAAYSFSTQEADARIEVPDLPFPIEVSADSTALSTLIPLAPNPNGGVSDLSASISYQNLTMGDPIWGMIDPGQAFPRDPISVLVDISGTVQMFVDLMSMDPTMLDAPPGEPRSLTLNELDISAGGARLTGSGAVTFAPGQVIPMPVGSVELQMTGSGALLDAIQAAGVAPPQELAMVRGMLGAFTRPGAAPDSIETTIEFTEGGGISANGVPLQ